MNDLQAELSRMGEELGVVGVAAAVLHNGEAVYAFHGVTNVEHPLPVDENTLFQFGSTGKTFTATAIMRLVEQGRIDLDAPVRTYVPELRVTDEDAASKVTVLQLLNHTAGWDGDLFADTGDGDDALEKYVAEMARLQQVTPLGQAVSYNNSSLSLAGRVIEKVAGKTYEQAVRELLFEPLGLENTFFFPKEIMTRRFACGHTCHADGRVTLNRPWAMPRSAAPAGGMCATAADQIAWARFHLGDGTAADGTTVLRRSTLKQMQEPTADMPGSALGDHVGISWLLSDISGVGLVGHGGTTNGQYSAFVLVPERDFAFVSMTNSGPNGPELNKKLEKWALERYLGLVEREPERIDADPDTLATYAGTYETIAAIVEIAAGEGKLRAKTSAKEAMRAILHEDGDEGADESTTYELALLSGPGDRFVVASGPAEGMKGYFARGGDGHVNGVHLGGRLAVRVHQ